MISRFPFHPLFEIPRMGSCGLQAAWYFSLIRSGMPAPQSGSFPIGGLAPRKKWIGPSPPNIQDVFKKIDPSYLSFKGIFIIREA
jgi:hypothetical protein